MQEWLTAADHDQSGTEAMQMIDPFQDEFDIYGFRKIVVLVAIGTRKVATANRNNVSLNNVVGVEKPMCNKTQFPGASTERSPIAPNLKGHVGHGDETTI